MVTIEFAYMRLVLYLLLVLVQHGHIPILLPTHFAGQEEAGPVRVVTAPPHMGLHILVHFRSIVAACLGFAPGTFWLPIWSMEGTLLGCNRCDRVVYNTIVTVKMRS